MEKKTLDMMDAVCSGIANDLMKLSYDKNTIDLFDSNLKNDEHLLFVTIACQLSMVYSKEIGVNHICDAAKFKKKFKGMHYGVKKVKHKNGSLTIPKLVEMYNGYLKENEYDFNLADIYKAIYR